MFCILFIFVPFSLNAALYKGQEEFVNACVGCHETRQHFIVTKNKKEWRELIENGGEKLAQIHLDSFNAKDSHDYFKSKIFIENSRHLMQFLMEYAKDSGNVPACN
ncbi:MAG TPA: cytochrome C [Sulfurimonas sp. UBA10385]|nr:MAG TPA: cytochrome C [Sulfurimonas sp. UBA10385]